jgi:hypothetical protein
MLTNSPYLDVSQDVIGSLIATHRPLRIGKIKFLSYSKIQVVYVLLIN